MLLKSLLLFCICDTILRWTFEKCFIFHLVCRSFNFEISILFEIDDKLDLLSQDVGILENNKIVFFKLTYHISYICYILIISLLKTILFFSLIMIMYDLI